MFGFHSFSGLLYSNLAHFHFHAWISFSKKTRRSLSTSSGFSVCLPFCAWIRTVIILSKYWIIGYNICLRFQVLDNRFINADACALCTHKWFQWIYRINFALILYFSCLERQLRRQLRLWICRALHSFIFCLFLSVDESHFRTIQQSFQLAPRQWHFEHECKCE